MARWLVIEGLRPWDGRNELPTVDEWTVLEWGWVKRYAGYLPGTIGDGFAGMDAELISVLAIIALHRAGRLERADVPELWERLEGSAAGAVIRLELDEVAEPDEEEDANPPPESSSGSLSISGPGSSTNGESSGAGPRPIGIRGSATSESARVESAS